MSHGCEDGWSRIIVRERRPLRGESFHSHHAVAHSVKENPNTYNSVMGRHTQGSRCKRQDPGPAAENAVQHCLRVTLQGGCWGSEKGLLICKGCTLEVGLGLHMSA